MSVSQKVLDAIELLAASSVKKAGYDKTIQAQILSCEDATIGKYRCRYQDSVFYAYSNNVDMTFTNGSYVYILVPGNDMSKQKTILGSIKKLGINYISQLKKDQTYNINGTNCVISNNIYYLDSNNKYYIYDIYNYENNKNNVILDIEALEHYIKQSSLLLVGATFRTQIPPARQYRGHYGIAFNLKFQDNTSNQQVIRTYIIDEDNMIDNPYRLIHDTRQYQVFDIDGSNFIRVQSIEIFNKDFPGAASDITTDILDNGDIIISNLEISGAEWMTENELNGIAISFYTPQGTFFTESSTSANYKTIIAQIKVKGKLISANQNIPFYWGRENVSITPSSQYYNKYLGRGWQCLNDKNVIEEATATTDPVIEWVVGSDTYILNFDQATARDNKFKVAVIYDGNVITKEINIQNLVTNMPVITIESSGGTKFYYDIGHPTLTCKVNDGKPENYTYYWAYESNTGLLTDLSETTDLNTDYKDAVAALESLQVEIASGTKYANAEAENLSNLTAAIKAYNFIQRVQGNKVYDVQIRNITNFGIFKCSVYNAQDIYLGTASITLTNSLEGEDLYSLVINNGSETFQYNENGVAPNSKSLDVQQVIQALTFTIYDNLGNPLNDEIINNPRNCQIRWGFPITDTMLVDQEENGQAASIDENYRYYDNLSVLTYNIAQRYDIKKQKNQIKLTIDYKGISLTTKTNFTFVKQGEPGTNGTEYVVKLIPNTRMDNPPLWPMITKAGSDYIVNYGINSTANETIIGINTDYKLFKAQLWHSGDLVWEGFSAADAATDHLTKPSIVRWQVLKNKYNYAITDDSAFNIIDSTTGNIQYTEDHLQLAFDTPLANIIKCSITWENKIYYATIPVITAWTYSENYRVGLKDYTGFRYVVYSSDGMSPQYDSSHPFEFIINEKINDIWEDISNISGDHIIEYTPGTCGNIKDLETEELIEVNLLTLLDNQIYRKGLLDNQWQYRPVSTYNGECVNQAVICTYIQNNIIVGKINIPIHFLLNKYGLANLNGWDGNSIQINEQGGYILSPQMGAGVKNNDNSFTGVLMGEVKTPTKNAADIGLMGYNDGDRTFFLNSQNGAALLGKQGKGQIVLDPSANKALLYSNNFWKDYNEEGLPRNYYSFNEAGEGLLIDLTQPEIRYGNGNFSIDENGNLHSISGTVGGWTISSESLQSTSNGRTTGLQIPSVGTYAIAVGSPSATVWDNAPFKVTHTGALTATNADIAGTINSTNGKIGGWTIDDSRIYSQQTMGDGKEGYVTINNAFYTASNTVPYNLVFGVRYDNDWKFYVRSNGVIYAKSGTIGGWTLGSDSLSAINTSAGYQVRLHVPSVLGGEGNGNADVLVVRNGTSSYTYPFVLSSNGHLTATNATITGKVTASSGAIAGWTITSDQIQFDSKGYANATAYGNIQGCLRSPTANFSGNSGCLVVQRSEGSNSWTQLACVYYDGTINGVTFNGGSFNTTSDRNLKSDINDLDAEQSAEFIYNLKPVNYRLTAFPDAVRHGFIAQDVEQIVYDPEWEIVNEGKDGTKNLGYMELIADLVATVQTQNERIKALEARIQALEER